MAGSLGSMERPSNRAGAPESSRSPEEDSVLAFDSEADAVLRASIRRRNSPLLAFAAVTALVAAAAGVYFLRSQSDAPAAAPRPVTPPAPAAPKTSEVVIDSRPDGAQIFVDGVVKGTTPATLSLPVGPHIL